MLLTEIEAILNFRPYITPMSSDSVDLSILTPSNFLIGDSFLQPVQHNLIAKSDNCLSRRQKLRQRF